MICYLSPLFGPVYVHFKKLSFTKKSDAQKLKKGLSSSSLLAISIRWCKQFHYKLKRKKTKHANETTKPSFHLGWF